MFFDVSSLPLKVFCDIVGSWLTLKSIPFLDSAFCNSRRGYFNHLLEAKEFVHRNPVLLSNKVVNWLRVKAMHISNIVLTVGLEPTQTVMQYFAMFGHSIRCVTFNQCNELEILYIVACFCKNIMVIQCTNVSLPSAFHAILLNNPNIKEIWLLDCNCPYDNLMSNVALHKLNVLCVNNADSKHEFLWSDTTQTRSLQRVELCLFGTNNLEHLTRQNSQLRSFGI